MFKKLKTIGELNSVQKPLISIVYSKNVNGVTELGLVKTSTKLPEIGSCYTTLMVIEPSVKPMESILNTWKSWEFTVMKTVMDKLMNVKYTLVLLLLKTIGELPIVQWDIHISIVIVHSGAQMLMTVKN